MRTRPLATTCAVATALIGGLALAGWLTGASTLTSWGTGHTIKSGTAIAFVVVGLAVLALRDPGTGGSSPRVAKLALALTLRPGGPCGH